MTFWQMIIRVGSLVGTRFIGAGLGFLSQVIFARLFTPGDVGIIFATMSAAIFITYIVTAGFPALNMVTLPRLMSLSGASRSVPAFHGAALRTLALAWLGMVAAILLVRPFLPEGSILRFSLVFGILVSLPGLLIIHNSATANSIRRFNLTYFPDIMLRSGLLLVLVGIGAALHLPMNYVWALWAAFAAAVSAALVQAWFLGRDGLLPGYWKAARPAFTRALRPRAVSLLVVALVASAFTDLVTILASTLLSPPEVAQVGVAIRLAAISAFVVLAAQQVVLPDTAAALVRRDDDAVSLLLRRMNYLTLGTMTTGVVGAVILGKWVLGFFGPTYAEAYGLLLMFMAGQTIRAMSGLNQHLLSLSGHQGETASACLVAVMVLVAVFVTATPSLGIMAMGWAVVAAESVWLLLLAGKAQRLVGRRGDLLWLLKHQAPAE